MIENEVRELCGRVRQAALGAHRYLRHGHAEKIYELSLARRLRELGIRVVTQHPLYVRDEDGSQLGNFYADMLLEDELIIEIKAVRQLADEHTAQVLGYLRTSGLSHAMLINFGAPVIQFKKLILDQPVSS